MLVIFEYYYEKVYTLHEIEISGEAKRKIETYEYYITKMLAKEIENKVKESDRQEFIDRVLYLKDHIDEFSELCGDGMKRVLKVNNILNNSEEPVKSSGIEISSSGSGNGINLNKLKELKTALEEGLISQEEFEKAKNKFLGL